MDLTQLGKKPERPVPGNTKEIPQMPTGTDGKSFFMPRASLDMEAPPLPALGMEPGSRREDHRPLGQSVARVAEGGTDLVPHCSPGR